MKLAMFGCFSHNIPQNVFVLDGCVFGLTKRSPLTPPVYLKVFFFHLKYVSRFGIVHKLVKVGHFSRTFYRHF